MLREGRTTVTASRQIVSSGSGVHRRSHSRYTDEGVRTFFAAGLKTKAGHSTTRRVDSFMKQPAINPESMTNPNTAAIMVSPKSREVITATLMMMIFFILLTTFCCASCIFSRA